MIFTIDYNQINGIDKNDLLTNKVKVPVCKRFF